MAAPRPKLTFGASMAGAGGAAKIVFATAAEAEEYDEVTPPAVRDGPKPVEFSRGPGPRFAPPAARAAAAASSIGAMFGPAKKKGAAPARAAALVEEDEEGLGGAAAAAADELPEVEESPEVDISKYDETLQDYAIDILGETSGNPYKDKRPRPVFPIQTRLGFQKQILKIFSSFVKVPEHDKAPDFDACAPLTSGQQQQVEIYEYQKFVREYIRQASPYRGLLVYHGLGSGKTCSAIAAAEALFSVSKKRIIIMTPASLRENFLREITFCGFKHFRLQNHWIQLDATQPLVKLFANEILGLSQEWIKKHKELWVPDFNEAPNWTTLDSEQRKAIANQVREQITNSTRRIEFINYNGITASKLKEIACRPPDADGNGFFDNAVIVVDEIHNMTRLMQGVIEPYLINLPGVKRKVPLEPVKPGRWVPELCKVVFDPRRAYQTNYKRGYLLYRLLSGARNSKIIGLSGTPLINFPEELGILANILGGYIHTSSFSLTPANEMAKATVEKILNGHKFIDFAEVELAGLNMNVLFTLLPEGIEKVEGGAQRLAEGKTPGLEEVTAEILETLKGQGFSSPRPPVFASEPLLPPISEEFQNSFLAENGKKLKNTVVLRKRLQGLISYYKGSKKELMPQITADTLVRVPMSAYAQAEYQRVRGAELKAQQDKKAKSGGEAALMAGKMGNLWAQIHELASMKASNSYRMFSRQACNFTFPEGIARPRPRDEREVRAEIGDDQEILDDAAMGEGGAPAEGGAAPAAGAEAELAGALPAALGDEGDGAAAEEDAAIDASEREARAAEALAAGGAEGEVAAAAVAAEGEVALIAEAAPAPAEPLPGAVAGGPPAAAAGKVAGLSAAARMRAQKAQEQEECKAGVLPGEDYSNATRRAKRCLDNFARSKLRLFKKQMNVRQEKQLAEGQVPDPSLLPKYSPKMAEILINIYKSPGSNLVYSQFLDMEGIGIFLVVLRANDFEPIVIESDGAGKLRFSEDTIKSLKKGPTVFRYLSFTGGEKSDVRAMALKVFNARYVEEEAAEGEAPVGKYPDLDPEMAAVLLESGFKGNLNGELCRVFCITSAGAEGLSLRNVRRVHIMEPYWNHVRTDQVKGRAVRICSHADLPFTADPSTNQRTVEVFTYCSVYSDQSLLHPTGDGEYPVIDQILQSNDGLLPEEATELGFLVPAGARQYIPTSDEYLYSLSERKKALLSSLQSIMKTSAVDCQINQYENEEEGLGCVLIPGTAEQYAYHPILKTDIAKTNTEFSESADGGIQMRGAPRPAAAAAAEGDEGEDADIRPLAVPLPAAARAPQAIKARVIYYERKPYLAVPVLEKGQVLPLTYDIYARADVYRVKKLGTTEADESGMPTGDIVFD